MKKKILLFALILISVLGVSTVLLSSKSKPIAKDLKYANAEGKIIDDADYLLALSEAGFTSIEEVKNVKYITQKKKYSDMGLTFLGDDEMSKFLVDNNFIIGPANRFLDNIPKEAGLIMLNNFKKGSFNKITYTLTTVFPDGVWTLYASDFGNLPGGNLNGYPQWTENYLTKEVRDKHGIPNTQNFNIRIGGNSIQIIAAYKCFNTEGMIIENRILQAPPPIDPIAVVKVTDGWVQLASW